MGERRPLGRKHPALGTDQRLIEGQTETERPGFAGLFCFGLTLDQALIRTKRRVLSTERAPFAHST